MSSDQTKKRSWTRRLIWPLLILIALLVLILIGLRIFITTSPGQRFIENQVNSRTYGPIERVEVSGLSGNVLNNFRVESLKLYDKEGVWLTASGIDMDWAPLDILSRKISIEDLDITRAALLRRPALNKTSPSGKPGYIIDLQTFDISALALNESIAGQAAVFKMKGVFRGLPDGNMTAWFNAVRTDAAGDSLNLDFHRNENGEMEGDFNLTGVPGGTMGNLLRIPEDLPVTGEGQIKGTAEQGQGDFVVRFADEKKISADGTWTEQTVNIEADLVTTDWPIFDSLRRGLGNQVNINGALDRTQTPMPFNATVKSPAIDITADGVLSESGGIPDFINMTAATKDAGAILPLPDGYDVQALRLSGHADLKPDLAFDGTADVNRVQTPYGLIDKVSGPLTVRQINDGMYRITTDASLIGLDPSIQVPVTLEKSASIKIDGVLDMSSDTLSITTADIGSGSNRLSGKGELTLDASSMEISGNAKLGLLPMGTTPACEVQTVYTINKTENSSLAVSLDGAFRPTTTMQPPLDQLLSGGANFVVNMEPVEGGVSIRNATVTGQNVKVALKGRIADSYSIDGEASINAPVAYDAIAISGNSQASFTLTGPKTDPALRLDSQSETVTISSYELNNARLRTEIANLVDAPRGPVQFEASTKLGDLQFSTQLASQSDTYVANDIDLTWGRVSAAGNLAASDSLVTGNIRLNLPEEDGQYARAFATLSAEYGQQYIAMDAEGKNFAIGDFGFDTFSAQANGTLSELTGTVEASGRNQQSVISREFDIAAPFSLSRAKNNQYAATLDPDAKYGNLVLSTEKVITAAYTDGNVTLEAPLTLNSAPVNINYAKSGAAETLEVDANNLPISLIPMPGNLADSRGRIAADFSVSSDSSGQTGGGVVTLSNWRGFDIDRDKGLSGTLNIDLQGPKVNWDLDADSPVGFTANGNGEFGLSPAQQLSGLRLNTNAPVSGQFTASGAAAAVLGLFTPSDAKPGGELEANLSLRGTAANPLIEGQINGKELRMEAPELGTRIRNGRFTANFTNDSLQVTDVSVSDVDNGTLSGAGDFKLGELGRPIGELTIKANNFRALDRRDVEGRVDGNLKFESMAKRSKLSGDVKIDRAEVKQFVTGSAAVVEIPVAEINRSDTRKPIEVKAPLVPIDLDVHVRAPRRIFVRSRGLDVEMSVDATIKGTLTDPKIYGKATVLRGGYRLAGKELDFTSGNITFDGEIPKAKVNLLAKTDTQNISAQVRITGTVEKPEIELTSSPERPKDEILSALLFGRSATELSTIEAAQLAGALAQFSGTGGGFDLLGGLRDALGVGQLSVGLSEDGTAQITGGRYLAKDVYLQVFSGGGPGQTGAVIDWEVRKNISLRSKVQSDNEQTFSLKWKRDF